MRMDGIRLPVPYVFDILWVEAKMTICCCQFDALGLGFLDPCEWSAFCDWKHVQEREEPEVVGYVVR